MAIKPGKGPSSAPTPPKKPASKPKFEASKKRDDDEMSKKRAEAEGTAGATLGSGDKSSHMPGEGSGIKSGGG